MHWHSLPSSSDLWTSAKLCPQQSPSRATALCLSASVAISHSPKACVHLAARFPCPPAQHLGSLIPRLPYRLLILFFFFFFRDRVSLYSLGYPGTHFVDQAGLELRDPPASASRVLGLKACATTPGVDSSFLFLSHICNYLCTPYLGRNMVTI
jgi:hypothetical protein